MEDRDRRAPPPPDIRRAGRQGLEPRVARGEGTYALVVVPTRELCLQVADVLALLLRRYVWLARPPLAPPAPSLPRGCPSTAPAAAAPGMDGRGADPQHLVLCSTPASARHGRLNCEQAAGCGWRAQSRACGRRSARRARARAGGRRGAGRRIARQREGAAAQGRHRAGGHARAAAGPPGQHGGLPHVRAALAGAGRGGPPARPGLQGEDRCAPASARRCRAGAGLRR